MSSKYKRADGKEYSEERQEDNADLRLAVQARLIADDRIRERAEQRAASNPPKKRRLL